MPKGTPGSCLDPDGESKTLKPKPTSLPAVVSIAGRPAPYDSTNLKSLLTRRKLLAETRQTLERLEKELDEDMDAFASSLID